ncbi:porin [Prosthecomicrobium hirschii]|uniref:porin n=1 Tax=Prosthecodimorpha hirschii TaxID=665126 RepID=UPI0011292811|nr:porin [Prosthecomicrobium hirschii]TPQ46355.1 porin [Prosthecomicrobium hirschii]
MQKTAFAIFAAAAVAASSASAADLGRPAPAAVDYVKVCDAYGEGFFYIPGSQTCLKIGGFVRAEYRVWKMDTDFAGLYGLNNGIKSPTSNDATTRIRAQLTLDTRTNTEFGLLRSFTEAWYTVDSGRATPSVDLWKAYLQLGGLTAGRAQSFFDFYTGDHYASVFETAHSDSQVNLLAYTVSFGNGVSATLSLEDQTTGNASRRAETLQVYGGNKYPDLVGNLAIAQAWGSAQVMAVAHNNQPYDSNRDKWGWAAGAGVTVKLPMIAEGDSATLQAAYGKGAVSYVAPDSVWTYDFYKQPNGSLDQTVAWSVAGGFTHNWNAKWSTSATVSYLDVDGASLKVFALNKGADSKQVDAGVNLVYAPVAGLTIGAEVEYKYVNFKITDRIKSDGMVGLLRVQRNF